MSVNSSTRAGNGVAGLLPLCRTAKVFIGILCLRLEGTQSKIFQMDIRGYKDQCKIPTPKLGGNTARDLKELPRMPPFISR